MRRRDASGAQELCHSVVESFEPTQPYCPSLGLGKGIHECPGRKDLDKATRGFDGPETVRVR